MHTVGDTKSRRGNGWVGVVLCAGSLAWFGCGSDKDDAADTEADALKPAEPTQLLSYSCRQDAALESTPPGSGAKLPKTFRQTQKLVGAAVNATGLDDPNYASTVATQFSQLTPENEMKWEAIEPERDSFDFTRADKIVAFAQQNGLKVRGHTLVWHSQLAPWVNDLTGDDLRQAMLSHIRGVVSHYRENFPGVVIAYDVVNEARDQMNGAMGAVPIYRDSIFYRELGADFIPEAFQAAHEADPDALLFYNDFGVEGVNGAKSTGMFSMVSDMVAQGVPINGVGFQMHTGPTDQGPGAADFRANIQRYADLGLKVDVTEMDVTLCSIGDNQLGRELQRYRYNRIVSACFDSPACRSVSLWGVSDPNSWLNDNGCTQGMIQLDTVPAPLAFAGDFGRKPAWWGIYDGLTGCAYQ